MSWVRIKHNRKLKKYLGNLAKQVKNQNKQTLLQFIISDTMTNSEFFATKNPENEFGLIFLVQVTDLNLYAIYGFSFEDQIEKAKKEGKEFFSDFKTVFDIVRHGQVLDELPEMVKTFWEDYIV
jgi:hypothetical protein